MNLTFKKCLFFCQKFAGVVQRPKIPWAFVGELVVVGAIFLAFQIGKSQFDRCTWQYGVLFAVQVLIMVTSTVASVLVRHKQNTSMDIPHRETTNNENGIANHIDLENESPSSMPAVIADASSWKAHRLIIIWAIVVCVGIIAGMVGLGGGVFIGPLMIELAVHPQTAAATSTLIVLFSSTIATVTFALYGRINLSYFAVYGPVCLVGGIVGTFVLSGLIRKWRMASLVMLVLSGLVVVSAALVAAFGGRQAAVALANGGKFEAADFCTA